MAQPPVITKLIEKFHKRTPIRAKSLLITLFGDVVSQHGETAWLASLVSALGTLGIDERLVRTSVFRLVKDGWLVSEKIGRCSYYSFSDYGRREYERAARRIYALEDTSWNGNWIVLTTLDVDESVREEFRRSLFWQGFRNLSPGTYAKPGGGRRALLEVLKEFDIEDKVLLMQASTDMVLGQSTVAKFVEQAWHLEELAESYRELMQRSQPLLRWLEKGKTLTPEDAFIARILLIHDYRRILLNDTALPEELLPKGWHGARAQSLVGNLYRRLTEQSCNYICTHMQSSSGPLPAAAPSYASRFASILPS